MERPKLKDHRAAMRDHLAAALGVGADEVNIKATTGVGIGFVGREEGVAALATVTVVRAG
jgi:2-C-methyl-D-erythritol 4-phosphate cytidylyltransferase/2-C-methyl-D-erythritol 2,4-cyclodiphosphate synthase